MITIDFYYLFVETFHETSLQEQKKRFARKRFFHYENTIKKVRGINLVFL